jgi:hypothetical protein
MVVSILLVAAVLTVIGALLFVIATSLRRISGARRPLPPAAPVRMPRDDPPPFGALPTLSDPVGPLGNPAPGADLSSNADSEREIYGE